MVNDWVKSFKQISVDEDQDIYYVKNSNKQMCVLKQTLNTYNIYHTL